jgi:hypothetical protein
MIPPAGKTKTDTDTDSGGLREDVLHLVQYTHISFGCEADTKHVGEIRKRAADESTTTEADKKPPGGQGLCGQGGVGEMPDCVELKPRDAKARLEGDGDEDEDEDEDEAALMSKSQVTNITK